SSSGTTRFTIANDGTVMATKYTTGVAHFDSSGNISSTTVNLNSGSTDISGTLPVANGGTGAVSFTQNGLLFGNAASPIGATLAGTDGQILLGVSGNAPAFGTL